MHTAARPAAAPAPAADPDFAFSTWMAEIDVLHSLRMKDPAAALAQLAARRGLWRGLTPAQEALLHIRCELQAGSALLMLGRQDEASASVDALERQLKSPLLAGADPELRRQAQRCGVACANLRATLAHSLGAFAIALRAYQQSLDLARAIGERRYEAHALVNLANTYEESGLPAEALVQLRKALDIAQAHAMAELAGDIHHNMGNALAAAGQVEQGLASNRRALDEYAALGLPQKEGYALVAIAERLYELGRLDEATQALRDREGKPGAFVNLQYEAYTHYLHGRIAVARHDGPAARAAFARSLAVTEGQLGDVVGQARSHLELARLALAEGDAATADQQGRRALALLEGSHAVRDLMHAHGVLSGACKVAGDLAQALAHHEAFHACYERCFNEESARKAALMAVRHEVDLAHAEAERQRVENARLTEALAAISNRLQAAGPAPAPAAGAPVTAEDLQGLGLTLREAQVLLWVAHGKTNEDVSSILGVSLSAVKKHLGSIYEKLGVENRTAAANAVRRRRRAQ